MFLRCVRCSTHFPAEAGQRVQRCPGCGLATAATPGLLPRDAPYVLAVPDGLHGLPAWARGRAGRLAIWAIPVALVGVTWTWSFILYWAMVVVLDRLWTTSTASRKVEVLPGLLRLSWTPLPWPGRWVPRSAVASLALLPDQEQTVSVVARLHGPEPVELVLFERVSPALAPALASQLGATLGASDAVDEVRCTASDRRADLRWDCGRRVVVRVSTLRVQVQVEGQRLIDLGSDVIEGVELAEVLLPRQVPRHSLVLRLRRGERLLAIDGEPFSDGLQRAAREIRRVLRLPEP